MLVVQCKLLLQCRWALSNAWMDVQLLVDVFSVTHRVIQSQVGFRAWESVLIKLNGDIFLHGLSPLGCVVNGSEGGIRSALACCQ